MIRLQKYLLLVVALGSYCLSCSSEPEKRSTVATTNRRADYIRQIPGSNDSIPFKEAQRGEVLIAYSDCHTCHTRDKRAKGPAFTDIAERYPVNRNHIEYLAHRIINGGYGAWGRPVMSPHPNLSREDAELMVKYILSLKADGALLVP
ncbi:c-type cytochrome [Flavihumibacter stibioxidans]|uniref:Cytochrome c domain-containing protein n=1 Tax=Flavihumibacter stibioxidans TaxID=1834163 RepID=A0ABR7M653_9BACT|nr:c-type cytochrome [Flavihumibacter stibioxidans]MBC6490088.1 hypothetical protein [Flavihumibacter stibioxidans]